MHWFQDVEENQGEKPVRTKIYSISIIHIIPHTYLPAFINLRNTAYKPYKYPRLQMERD